MGRERIGAVVLVAVVLGAIVVQQSGKEVAPEPVVVAEVPLRVAAATPDAVWDAPMATDDEADAVAVADAALPRDPCAESLEVFVEEGAMLGLTLLAPCRAGERVVLRHGGLAVSMRTLATGSLFATLPAMDPAGAVEVRFDDGASVTGTAAVPEMAGLRRFAVQWQGDDRFAVNGFEDGAGYGEAGFRSVATGGVMALGDAGAAPALLAEVYTFPDPDAAVITVEAEVTAATCGRELLGETLYAADGAVRVTDLTLAMPDCDALGGFVVLNNPLPDMTLAAAE